MATNCQKIGLMNFIRWNNTERQDFILLLQLNILQAMYKSFTI
jgi:hypothetical protein